MEKSEFRRRLKKATTTAVEFAGNFVRESLPDSVLYRISLNSSYDGNPLDADEVVFPNDSQFAKSASLVGCTEEQFVDALWREGRIPEWIDLNVIAEDGQSSVIQALSCGRYTNNEELLYHRQEGYPPFHVCGPPLPVGYEDGDRFSLYHNAECWTWDEVSRLPVEGDAPWSLKLLGSSFDDDALLGLPTFPSLEILELQDVPLLGNGLAGLGSQPKLRVLRLRLSEMDSIALEHLPKLKALENLDLVGLPANTAGFEDLAKSCPKLTSLTVESDTWRPAAWPKLKRLQSLTLTTVTTPPEPCRQTFSRLDTLSLHGDGVTTSFATAALEASPKLTAAHLYGSAVDDGVLAAVEQHPRLEYLSVVDTGVGLDAIKQLLSKRPDLRVHPRPTQGNSAE